MCGGIFDLESKKSRLAELEELQAQPDFWTDNDKAQQTIAEINDLRSWLNPYHDLEQRFESAREMLPEAYESEEQELIDDIVQEIYQADKDLTALEVRKMLSGELDKKNCYLSINAGAGGTEACDWVQMLARMYERWAARRGWKVEVVDQENGDVAGLKGITFKLSGDYTYGYAKAEKGVHRLVRISPFDSNKRRHTSFASVDVAPEITDDINIEVKPDDIRVDTYRSSGAGGQHVNVTDSAVRITHFATGIVVTCQNERSQVQNKETAMKILKSKLYEKKVLEREESLKDIGGEKKKIEWGSQIRNYVFQPYTMVKDTRTKTENSNIQAVMDGDIDDFVISYLKEYS
ncbi:MAG: peptide chain release factor 2 [Chlamydiota bacterium]